MSERQPAAAAAERRGRVVSHSDWLAITPCAPTAAHLQLVAHDVLQLLQDAGDGGGPRHGVESRALLPAERPPPPVGRLVGAGSCGPLLIAWCAGLYRADVEGTGRALEAAGGRRAAVGRGTACGSRRRCWLCLRSRGGDAELPWSEREAPQREWHSSNAKSLSCV